MWNREHIVYEQYDEIFRSIVDKVSATKTHKKIGMGRNDIVKLQKYMSELMEEGLSRKEVVDMCMQDRESWGVGVSTFIKIFWR